MPNITFSQHDQNNLFNSGTYELNNSKFLWRWAIIDFAYYNNHQYHRV